MLLYIINKFMLDKKIKTMNKSMEHSMNICNNLLLSYTNVLDLIDMLKKYPDTTEEIMEHLRELEAQLHECENSVYKLQRQLIRHGAKEYLSCYDAIETNNTTARRMWNSLADILNPTYNFQFEYDLI